VEQIENRQRIDQTVRKSLANEVITALPAGYDQQLGKRFTGGAELPGGQWQTIALSSQRFSTVRSADRIVVLGNGRLLEVGTHAELISRAGRYAELFSLQAQGYQ
jgi:ATP-binding cassette subfamily B protein